MNIIAEQSNSVQSLRERALEAFRLSEENAAALKAEEQAEKDAEDAPRLKAMLLKVLKIDAEPTANRFEIDGLWFAATIRNENSLQIGQSCPSCGDVMWTGSYVWDMESLGRWYQEKSRPCNPCQDAKRRSAPAPTLAEEFLSNLRSLIRREIDESREG